MYKLALKRRRTGLHLHKIKSINSLFKYRLKHSKIFKKGYNYVLKKYKKKGRKKEFWMDYGLNFTGGNNDSDKDLHLSVGHSETIWKVYIKGGKIKTRVHIADTYDFKKFSKKDAKLLVRIINNFGGYYPQKAGILHPYNWNYITYF